MKTKKKDNNAFNETCDQLKMDEKSPNKNLESRQNERLSNSGNTSVAFIMCVMATISAICTKERDFMFCDIYIFCS